jgi:hypothetical protein
LEAGFENDRSINGHPINCHVKSPIGSTALLL